MAGLRLALPCFSPVLWTARNGAIVKPVKPSKLDRSRGLSMPLTGKARNKYMREYMRRKRAAEHAGAPKRATANPAVPDLAAVEKQLALAKQELAQLKVRIVELEAFALQIAESAFGLLENEEAEMSEFPWTKREIIDAVRIGFLPFDETRPTLGGLSPS